MTDARETHIPPLNMAEADMRMRDMEVEIARLRAAIKRINHEWWQGTPSALEDSISEAMVLLSR